MQASQTKRQRLESLFATDKTLIDQSAATIAKEAKKRMGLIVGDNYVSMIRKEFKNGSNGNGHHTIAPSESPTSRLMINIEDVKEVAAFARAIGGIDKLIAIANEIKIITQ